MIAAHQLRLGLGQIERQAIGLGIGSDEEDQKSQRLGEDVPPGQHAGQSAGLVGHDIVEAQRPHQHEHADDGHAQ